MTPYDALKKAFIRVLNNELGKRAFSPEYKGIRFKTCDFVIDLFDFKSDTDVLHTHW